MYTYIVGVSQDGRQVYTNLIDSIAGRYISRQPHLVKFVKEVIEKRTLDEPVVTVTQDMGRVVGNTNIVATEEKDYIYYARPPKRHNVLRFVKNRSMEPSNLLTIIVRRDDEGNYELANLWIGPYCPPFPDAADVVSDSKAFWQTHALVSGSEIIDSQSITRDCPYVD